MYPPSVWVIVISCRTVMCCDQTGDPYLKRLVPRAPQKSLHSRIIMYDSWGKPMVWICRRMPMEALKCEGGWVVGGGGGLLVC